MHKSSDNQHGKTYLITGATAGIGLVTARTLAEQGGTVAMVGRNPEKGNALASRIRAMTGNDQIFYYNSDLSIQAEVRRLADEFLSQHDRLDVLVNNAGGIFTSRQLTVDGIERTFALNHLSYFLLTNLLLDVLKISAPARIINVSSGAHRNRKMNFDDLQFKRGYRLFKAYGQSKLANVLFTYELARRLEGTRVTANALHPGLVATDIARENNWLFRLLQPVILRNALTPEQGAATSIYLATAPEVAEVSGCYFYNQEPIRSSSASYDEEAARRLWEVSAQMTGLVLCQG
jgi:NAD(P)-dependent dehydrogenase (short-subunit alcohol dehydrogenase family)